MIIEIIETIQTWLENWEFGMNSMVDSLITLINWQFEHFDHQLDWNRNWGLEIEMESHKCTVQVYLPSDYFLASII